MNRSFAAAAAAFGVFAGAAAANVVITEVHPTGSGDAPYAADWFELTNTGASALDITGWRMDDGGNSFAVSVPLRGLTSIPAGASVVFIEGNSTGTTDATIGASFINAWFGGTAPSNFLLGFYGGSGVGFSTGGDGVNIFNSGGTNVAGISFGAATSNVSFDNAAGLSGPISQLSVAGVNNAFVSPANEVGSPGLIPTPGAAALLAIGGLMAGRRRR